MHYPVDKSHILIKQWISTVKINKFFSLRKHPISSVFLVGKILQFTLGGGFL